MSDEHQHNQADVSFSEAKKLSSLSEKDKSIIEKEQQPGAEKAIEILQSVESELGPAAAARLVESNVVLTLAGERGHTEYYGESIEAGQDKAKRMNPILKNLGIRLTPRPSAKNGLCMVVESLEGYEKVSKISHIPGIEPFDRASGWDGLDSWIEASRMRIKQACEDGRIKSHDLPDHILMGVIKGYPDKAVIGRFSIPDTFENKHLFSNADIKHAEAYDAAQPIYGFLAEDDNNPEITEHMRRWSEVLENFYNSAFHQELAAKPEFMAARKQLEK